MDEHIEHGDDTSAVARSAFGRREMLQRTGFVVGAAALWATPVVQTIGMRPAAATGRRQYCEDGPPGNLSGLTLQYDGGNNRYYEPNCSEEELENFKNPGGNVVGGQDDPTFSPQKTCDVVEARIIISNYGIDDVVKVGALIPVLESNATSRMDDPIYEICRPDGTLSGEIHTSCSQTLCIGDKFGSLTVISLRLTDGTIIS